MNAARSTAYVCGGLGLGLFVFWLVAPYYSTQLFWELRTALPYLLILGACVMVLLVCAYLCFGEDMGGGMALLGVVGALGALVGGGFWMAQHSYSTTAAYAESVSVAEATAENSPQYSPRLPYPVARAQGKTALTDAEGTTILDDTTRYVPNLEREGGVYTTLVEGRSMWGRYQAVMSQDYTGGGRSTGSQCTFTEQAQRILGGENVHSLGRLINSTQRGVNWSDSDAYGVCVEEIDSSQKVVEGQKPATKLVPKVIVPLKKHVGWWTVTEVPAGAAIYNGHTGDLVIETDSAKVPGSAYPLSLFKTQRDATKASGSFYDWMMNRVGYAPAPDAGVNDGNNGFVLRNETGGAHVAYTDPMTYVSGGSTSIVALSTLNATDWTVGERSTVQMIKTNPQWASIEAIEKRIISDFGNIPNWQTIAVQEVLPLDANTWVATIGNAQNISYVVRGTGSLNTPLGDYSGGEAVCLYRLAADYAPDWNAPIQCGTNALRDGAGVGTAYDRQRSPDEEQPTLDGVPPAPSGDLRQMSTAELVDLLRQIAEEMGRRPGQ